MSISKTILLEKKIISEEIPNDIVYELPDNILKPYRYIIIYIITL
jgi:hypothetical protein